MSAFETGKQSRSESSDCCRWGIFSCLLLWTRNVVFGLTTVMKLPVALKT